MANGGEEGGVAGEPFTDGGERFDDGGGGQEVAGDGGESADADGDVGAEAAGGGGESAGEEVGAPDAAGDGGEGSVDGEGAAGGTPATVEPDTTGKRPTADESDRGRDDVDRAPFPPDEVLDLPGNLTFVRLLLVVALLGFVVDFTRVHVLAGRELSDPIPYSYQFFVAVVYLLVAIPLVRRVYDVIAAVETDLVHLAGRETLVGGRLDEDLTPAEIDAEMTRILRRYFHPRVLLGGAAVAGLAGLAVLLWVNYNDVGGDWVAALSAGQALYPHYLTGFAYAAAHGLFAGPVLGDLVLVRRAANEYIVDVDVLAPDGIGGYRTIGDAHVSLLTYAVVLLTVDFVVMSSILPTSSSLLGEPQGVVVGIYVVGLVGMLGIAVVAVVAIRNRLLTVRDRKVDELREKFEAVEAAYWEKLEAGEDNTVEAENLRIMRAMFVELNGLSLWPLNLLSVLRVVASVVVSVGTSMVVFALKNGLLS